MCTAILYIAAGLGALLTHYPMERIGRRGTLLACDVLFVTGGLLCSIVPDYRLIVVGRTLTGIGIGAVLTAVPTLFTEIAPASQRGFVGFVHTIAITFGSWACSVVGAGLVSCVDGGWRGVFLVLVLTGTLQLLLAPLVPESPRWLNRHRDTAAALAALRARRPVVLEHSGVLARAAREWTTDYLRRELGDYPCTVLSAPASTRRFTHYFGAGDDRVHAHYECDRTVRAERLSFGAFVDGGPHDDGSGKVR